MVSCIALYCTILYCTYLIVFYCIALHCIWYIVYLPVNAILEIDNSLPPDGCVYTVVGKDFHQNCVEPWLNLNTNIWCLFISIFRFIFLFYWGTYLAIITKEAQINFGSNLSKISEPSH